MSLLRVKLSDQRRRFLEFVALVISTLVLIGLSRLETRLFELSKDLSSSAEFFTSVVFFSLINLNVIFILILSFIIFRNIAKIVIERRHGVLGSRLRTKLILTLVFFSVVPTILMFYISTRFITSSFDTWFSSKVQDTMARTREVGAQVYKQDQRRLESLARIAVKRIRFRQDDLLFPGQLPSIDPSGLESFAREYHIYAIKIFNVDGRLIWESKSNNLSGNGPSDKAQSILIKKHKLIDEARSSFYDNRKILSFGGVEADQDQDVVWGIAPIYDPERHQLVGFLIAEERFEMQILRSIENIISDFAKLRPNAQLIRLSYIILLVVMVLLIIFSTIWLGFYVARRIVQPIQKLAEATREVALGNYEVNLRVDSDDEAGALIRAFNKMTHDLQEHEKRHLSVTEQLRKTNEELNRRTQYMAVVLRNITAGVMSVDAEGYVRSFNKAAERLLSLRSSDVVGKPVQRALDQRVYQDFWLSVSEQLEGKDSFTGQVVLRWRSRPLTLVVAGLRISNEYGDDLGVVVVFDDATEQERVQRIAAWREVARRIAHEIKNPITPIKLNAQRLLRRYQGKFSGEDQKIFESCLKTIIDQVDSLRNLVNEFSKFTRLPTVKTELCQLRELVENVVAWFQESYAQIQFEVLPSQEELPLVELDQEQMRRVLINLIQNAIAAVQGQPDPKIKLWFEVAHDLNVLRLIIQDNGCGVDPAISQRVFEPYVSTKRDGTGLGLAIVSQIIAEHGGYVRLLPNKPRGTSVIIEIPLTSATKQGSIKSGATELIRNRNTSSQKA